PRYSSGSGPAGKRARARTAPKELETQRRTAPADLCARLGSARHERWAKAHARLRKRLGILSSLHLKRAIRPLDFHGARIHWLRYECRALERAISLVSFQSFRRPRGSRANPRTTYCNAFIFRPASISLHTCASRILRSQTLSICLASAGGK